jgi:hypothetical protein
MTIKGYLLSFPERFVRAALGLGAGVAREAGEVALPEGIRSSQLYQNLVDAMLRFLIERIPAVRGPGRLRIDAWRRASALRAARVRSLEGCATST